MQFIDLTIIEFIGKLSPNEPVARSNSVSALTAEIGAILIETW